MNEIILYPGNWLYNVGVVGFWFPYRSLKKFWWTISWRKVEDYDCLRTSFPGCNGSLDISRLGMLNNLSSDLRKIVTLNGICRKLAKKHKKRNFAVH